MGQSIGTGSNIYFTLKRGNFCNSQNYSLSIEKIPHPGSVFDLIFIHWPPLLTESLAAFRDCDSGMWLLFSQTLTLVCLTTRSHPTTKANFIPEIEYRISLLCWTERGLDNLISGLCLQNKISQRETMCRGQKVITRKWKNAGARGKQFQFGEFGNLGKWIMFHENYIRCMTSSVDEWMNKRK